MMHVLKIIGAVIAWLLGLAVLAYVLNVFGGMIGITKGKRDEH